MLMVPDSLKNTLLVVVAVFVIVPGLVISQVIAHRYSKGLLDLATSRARHIAHHLAIEVSDKILLQDIVGLQKRFDEQIADDDFISYLFILHKDQVLVHTFSDGIPKQLIEANSLGSSDEPSVVKIVSEKGERYIDIAYPVLGGAIGVLRMGFSEAPYQKQVRTFWIQVSVIALTILCLTLVISQWAIARLLQPLELLARYAERIDVGNPDLPIQVAGAKEVMMLASAFNAMLERLCSYTQRLKDNARELEEKNNQLEMAHRQLGMSFSITQTISTLSELDAIGSFLIQSLKEATSFRHMSLVVFDIQTQISHLITAENRIDLDPTCYEPIESMIQRYPEAAIVARSDIACFSLPNIPEDIERIALFPVRDQDLLIGALVVGCDHRCECAKPEMDLVQVLLHQTAGALHRACIQEDQLRQLRTQVDSDSGFGDIVGKDPKMQMLFQLIEDVAPTDATVLIQGESGTGKELVARAIHNRSHRAKKPFIVINCAAYPSTLLESELFGHEKGAFTGAVRRKIGRFEIADGGTVFLDEIGEIEPMAQTRLLRVLQQQTIDRLGGEHSIKVDVRILAATNRNLIQEVRLGKFREDLFYRLNVVPIEVPPLRERKRDIHLLARHFLHRFSKEQGKAIQGFRSEVLRKLIDYPWPGNVRELENTIEHAVVLSKSPMIELCDLPTSLFNAPPDECNILTIQEVEKHSIRKALEDSGWNKAETARKLGISRSTLYEKMKKFQIVPPSN